jgi:cell division protein FtsL
MSGAHAAVHAAQQRKQGQEEEEMTQYRRDELENDWEFKIVRTTTGAFRSRQAIEELKAQEGLAGWVMVEKFDNNRVRFKRPLSAQMKDAMLPPEVDPYRTQYGISEAGLAFMIIAIVLGFGGLMAVLANAF